MITGETQTSVKRDEFDNNHCNFKLFDMRYFANKFTTTFCGCYCRFKCTCMECGLWLTLKIVHFFGHVLNFFLQFICERENDLHLKH